MKTMNSLLDTDLYKFTMMQVVFHHFPKVEVEYRLFVRTPNVDLSSFVDPIKEALDAYCALSLSSDELAYLRGLGYFSHDFMAYLEHYRLDKSAVTIETQQGLQLTIRGTWLATILFEVPLLAMISEMFTVGAKVSIGRDRLEEKIAFVKKHADPRFQFSDFGTRRRFSQAWHEEVITRLQEALPENFIGTSNVYFAKALNLTPIGTMAHEYMQAFQVLAPTIKLSQPLALSIWLSQYRDHPSLTIALADTIHLAAFLKEFDLPLAEQYQGIRQDSGNLSVLGEQVIKHYQHLGLDARKKSLVLSGNLTLPSAWALHQQFVGRILPVLGIGTDLTNDMGDKSLDMVIKMVACNHLPVAKITDDPHKAIALDDDYLRMLRQLYP